jgi:hypothetical protein
MKDGPTPGPNHGPAGAPLLLDVLEDRKTEPNDPFLSSCRGREHWRLNRTKHVMDTADEEFVFVTEVRVKG